MTTMTKRQAWLLLVYVVLACMTILWSMTQGAASISFHEAFQALTHTGQGMEEQILWNIRFPRIAAGAFVGANLAVSGAILQVIMKNPLADPHIIGISSGAGLAGIFVLLLMPQMTFLLPPVAFVGAMGASVLIYLLSWKHGIEPMRIILAGVAVSTFLGAIISGLLIFYSDRVHGALLWMIGGLSARSWSDVILILPYTIIGIAVACYVSPVMNVLRLGSETAETLGVSVERLRVVLTALAALLAASAVSVAGLLGFVGLIVPHTARLLGGSDHSYVIPASALLGAIVVTLCDTIARIILAPVELPAGIIMAGLGGPFFLYLLRRHV